MGRGFCKLDVDDGYIVLCYAMLCYLVGWGGGAGRGGFFFLYNYENVNHFFWMDGWMDEVFMIIILCDLFFFFFFDSFVTSS